MGNECSTVFEEKDIDKHIINNNDPNSIDTSMQI